MAPLVYFVRHGQTDWNVEGRLQGQADKDINAVGRAQADRNGERLAQLIDDPSAFDFVASPLRRTRETMERVRARMDLDPADYRTEPRLMELDFGDWEGFTYTELEQRQPGCTNARQADKWNFSPPAGESYAALLERVRPWFETIAKPTVCVTHGGVMRVVLAMLGGELHIAPQTEVPQDRILRWRDGKTDWL